MVYIKKRTKAERIQPDLKEVLAKAISDSEDLKLLDNEVYGNLKREVKIGKNHISIF